MGRATGIRGQPAQSVVEERALLHPLNDFGQPIGGVVLVSGRVADSRAANAMRLNCGRVSDRQLVAPVSALKGCPAPESRRERTAKRFREPVVTRRLASRRLHDQSIGRMAKETEYLMASPNNIVCAQVGFDVHACAVYLIRARHASGVSREVVPLAALEL